MKNRCCIVGLKKIGAIGFVFISSLIISPRNGIAQPDGAKIFGSVCVACHTIGGGRLVGPDLSGVEKRRKTEWIHRFVKSSQSLVQGGDPEAVALFKEYNQIPMPDQALSDAEIDAILQYIRSQNQETASPSNPATEKTVTPPVAPVASAGILGAKPLEISGPPTGEIAKGQDLFQGLDRFANKGPACNSCHHVKNDAVIGGGILARELTTVFSRMSGTGVTAILGSPPFPVMEQAYKNNPLTEEEIHALAAFLEYADQQHSFQQPRDYGMRLFTTGLCGALLLFGLLSFIRPKRKKRGVYDSIYERQNQEKTDSRFHGNDKSKGES